eukprot:352701-Chlamydomonas_euryale.AAC.1
MEGRGLVQEEALETALIGNSEGRATLRLGMNRFTFDTGRGTPIYCPRFEQRVSQRCGQHLCRRGVDNTPVRNQGGVDLTCDAQLAEQQGRCCCTDAVH